MGQPKCRRIDQNAMSTPKRFSGPGHRVRRVTGVTIWPAPRRAEHSAATCKLVSSSSGPRSRTHEGNKARDPRARDGPLSSSLPPRDFDSGSTRCATARPRATGTRRPTTAPRPATAAPCSKRHPHLRRLGEERLSLGLCISMPSAPQLRQHQALVTRHVHRPTEVAVVELPVLLPTLVIRSHR